MPRSAFGTWTSCLALSASSCGGIDQAFVALEGPNSGQWILIEGEGSTAELTALVPGQGVFRAPEGTRIRVLSYETPAFSSPLPAISIEGETFPTPTALLELAESGDEFGWRESAFNTLELRLPAPSPCSSIESEALIPLPLHDPEETHRSSLLLRDGRLLIGAREHLYIVAGEAAERSTWSATTAPGGGPRALSEGADGLWFEAANELYFARLNLGDVIEPELQRVLPPQRADFVFTNPEEAGRLFIVDIEGQIHDYTMRSGPQLLARWRINAQIAIRRNGELVMVLDGSNEVPSTAEFARYRGGVVAEDAPFGNEVVREVKFVVHGDDYFVGGDGGRAAVDLGEGWQRVDAATGSMSRVRSFAPTERGFLMGTNLGEIVEHIWDFGSCPAASLQATRLEAIHALGGDRYLLVPESLRDKVRIIRLRPP